MIRIEIPGREPLELAHIIIDVNGTLTCRGELLDGIHERISQLKRRANVHLASADTFGTLTEIAASLEIDSMVAPDAASKLQLVEKFGPAQTTHIGNGSNDAAALQHAVLGIAVLGPEGLSAAALATADIVCSSALDALDNLLDPWRLAATLRA